MSTLLKVEGLYKKFCSSLKRSMFYGTTDMTRDMLGFPRDVSKLRKSEFWALQNINFELNRGECLGLIGKNGCGKTTLLRLINGIFPPDKGRIEFTGRMGGLIAVGAGFHPHMTGRENIYLNGIILGMTKSEIEKKIEKIIDFAEIGEFVNSPVATYSSGMTVRLGFAIASQIKPDILLIDEVLAVGDMGFTIKCLNEIGEIIQNSAVLFVSHNMQFVSQICTQIFVMDNGKIALNTKNISEGIDFYNRQFKEGDKKITGSGKAELLDIQIESDNSEFVNDILNVNYGCTMQIKFDFKINYDIKRVKIYIYIEDRQFRPIIEIAFNDNRCIIIENNNEIQAIKVTIPKLELNFGFHSILIAFVDSDTDEVILRVANAYKFYVKTYFASWASIITKASWEYHIKQLYNS
jgi:lipopolysaccharide transport system ATP-binding protein